MRGRRSFGVRRVPKKLDWTGAQLRAVGVGNSKVAAYIVDPTVLRDLFTSPTLMATRCQIISRQSGSLSVNGGFTAFGVIRWDDIDDFPPAAGESPGPLSNIDLDWILRVVAPIPAGTPDGTQFGQNLDKVYESKARRKLENTSGLLGVFETVDVIADFAVDVRVLLKQV